MNTVFNELFIFEMANNHQGSVEHGIAIINKLGDIKKKYNIEAAVKFQYRDLDTFVHPDYKNRKDVKHIPRFMANRLTNEQFSTLVKHAKKANLITMCTPFDEKSVGTIIKHEIDIIKVASCSALDWPLLQKISQANKPVIISTGGKTFPEMDKIFDFFTRKNVQFAMLHCVGMYPVEEEHVQLNCIKRMKQRYKDISIGYSGHENPNDFSICKMAVAMGASIYERHVGLKTDNISLNAYSTDVNDLGYWVEAIFSAKRICGGIEKQISEQELQSMRELARGCYAKVEIRKGETISREKVFFAMPCQTGQTTSGEFIDETIATKKYDKNEAITETGKEPLIKKTHAIIHEVKGMINEANIVVGNNFLLELSHHYGLKNFREVGVTIINIINREYCKKYIIVLPGQKHPIHYHKKKEETFQVLSGELDITLDEKEYSLRSGEIVTIERLVKHSFSSAKGCIFEEISTTHIIDDSYYDDENIAKLEVSERKTILENW